MIIRRALLAGSMLAGFSMAAGAADFSAAPVYNPPAQQANNTVSGYVDVYVGFGEADPSWDCDGACDYDQTVIGGAGRANIWLTPAVALQIDAWGDSTSFDFGPAEASYTSFGIGGHLAWRDPSRYAMGGMLTVGDVGLSRWATLAAEGQMYFGNITLYGQLGYLSAFSGVFDWSYDASAWYLMGEVRYFPMPNLMVAGHLGYDDFDFGGCSSCLDGWRWGIEAEYQPAGWPVAGFIAYQGSSHDFDGYDWDEHVFLIGGKVLLGQPDLQSITHNGATFVDYNPAYGEHRIRGIGLFGTAEID